MIIIGITPEKILPDESRLWAEALENGVDLLHLRKPDAPVEEIRRLLEETDTKYYGRIVLHNRFDLAVQFGLKGIHLNRRENLPPENFTGSISRSCHSLDELRDGKNRYAYQFLSPIFDSISKTGYASSFPDPVLKAAAITGNIDRKCIALGGITPERIPYLESIGFGGAALLGYLWSDPTPKGVRDRAASIQREK